MEAGTALDSDPHVEVGSSDVEQKFMKGVAISVWQNSGDDASQWTWFAEKAPWRCGCFPRIMDHSSPRPSSDFWERYAEDIRNAAEVLGCNSFRFSFEWSRIEPEQGIVDPAAIARYHAILDCMEKHGVEPNATMHHFTHPLWFERQGGFENESCLENFVGYARRLYQEFGKRIRMWCTFNEPTCYVFCAYIVGIHPPAKLLNFGTAGVVLRNLLRCHDAAFAAVKALPGGAGSFVGLVHHMMRVHPRRSNLAYWPVSWAARWMTFLWGWDLVPDYFLTGKLMWKVPVWGNTFKYEAPSKPQVDWWGVNYYCCPTVEWYFGNYRAPREILTDMGYCMYSPGMYDALQRCSQLGVPMYVTETGTADRKDAFRDIWIESYSKEMLRAMQDGCDVRGIFYWTLVDNFEWNAGLQMRFGLYQWEQDGSADRRLREGARSLIQRYRLGKKLSRRWQPEELAARRQCRHRFGQYPGQDIVLREDPAVAQELDMALPDDLQQVQKAVAAMKLPAERTDLWPEKVGDRPGQHLPQPAVSDEHGPSPASAGAPGPVPAVVPAS